MQLNPTTTPRPLHKIPSPSPLENPLLPNPRHELNPPLANPPAPTCTRQNFLLSLFPLTVAFAFRQNQFIHVLAISGTDLPGPFVLAEVYAGEVGGGVGSVAGG
jgi:hypothetical protein